MGIQENPLKKSQKNISEKEVYYHGEINIDYSSQESDLLNTTDLQVLQNGKRVNVQKRLEDIEHRYCTNSSVYEEAKILAKNLHLQ